MSLPTTILAGGVLGVAGYGIYRRSQILGSQADTLQLPLPLELKNRAWVSNQFVNDVKDIQTLLGGDLGTFMTVSGWLDGTLNPAHANDVANVGGQLWPYGRLAQASGLNMMALINDAHARTATPPVRTSLIGTAASPFDLTRTEPLAPRPTPLASAVEKVELYIRTEVPLPNAPPNSFTGARC